MAEPSGMRKFSPRILPERKFPEWGTDCRAYPAQKWKVKERTLGKGPDDQTMEARKSPGDSKRKGKNVSIE